MVLRLRGVAAKCSDAPFFMRDVLFGRHANCHLLPASGGDAMNPAQWKQTTIFKSPGLKAPTSEPIDDRQRDMRPGRFAVTGAFIKLPESAATTSPHETRGTRVHE